jgi:hypothetical protein
MDEDGPEVDENEKDKIEMFLERKDEDEKMIGDGLSITVYWMESVRCEGCWDCWVRKLN